jgi:hypothetical protein
MGVRYALPIVPLMLVWAAEGLLRLFGRWPRLIAACAVIALTASAFNLRTLETGTVEEGIAQRSFVEVCAFLKEQSPAEAVILSWNPRVFALYTGRPSMLYPSPQPAGTFMTRIPARRPLLLVIYRAQTRRETLEELVQRNAPAWRLAYSNSDFDVYALR